MYTPTDAVARDARREQNTPRDDNEQSQASEQVAEDDVNHPSHYQSDTGLEVIEAIEAFNPNPVAYMLGNVMKYISRVGKKAGNPRVKDLRKARWYLDRAIKHLEARGE